MAGGELQNKTQLKPKRIPALGGQAAEEQVQILPRFTPLPWKRLRNPAAVEMSKLTHIMLSQHIFRDPTVLLHTHTHTRKCLKCYILETKIFKKDLKIYTNVLLRNNHYRSKASF